ncbi:MAG: hypothetical protein FRX48_00800 [Lasallia pustulata]|uniref:WSC domain-containing protein n=1 Tax=Lasallia pustulata TaxID=136370 RepID=A0A5M8Q4Z9_9LECA|nr:MAG: hypothetical protein FRX48_00800 [Lasallia pustulata]
MKYQWGAILALCGHAVASAQQAPILTVTQRINTGTCVPYGDNGGLGTSTGPAIGTATGTGSSGGSTGVAIAVSVVNSNSGEIYGLRGCYSTPISGNILDGQSIVTTEMTLTYCATFCQGSSNYFAIQNGNQCMCGVATPATAIVDLGECSTGCVGNAAESCGAFRYAIIYSSSSTPAGSTSDIVYTTTNSQGSTIIMTSTSVAPVTVPSYSTSVSVYTTTNSYGSTVVTSSTKVVPVPVPSYSSSVSVYTTTNSQGSTVVTSSTAVVPVSSPIRSAIVTVVTTTNSQGSVVTTTMTSTSTAEPTLCPGGSGTTYVDADGNVYEIECGVSYPGSDLPAVHTDTFSACILACSNWVPQASVAGGATCVAASWGEGNPGGNCYRKYAIGEVNPTNGGFDSCRLVSYTPSKPPTTITTGSGATSTSSQTRSSSPISSAIVTVVTTTNGQGSVVTTTMTSTSTAEPTLCPGGSGTTYVDADGNVYEIECGVSYPGSDLPAVHADTFSACILACSNWVPQASVAGGATCVAASWGEGNPGGNCYRKYAIGEVNPTNGGFDSCRLVSYTPSKPPTTITTGSGATSTSSQTRSSSTTSTSSSPRGSDTTPTSSSPGGSGITSTSSIGTSTTTTSTSTINSLAAESPCPSADGTVYSTSFNSYDIDCRVSFPGNDLIAVHYDTFIACLGACDTYLPNSTIAGGASCVAASWGQGNVGGNCYLKYAITEELFNDGGFCSGQQTNYNPPMVLSSTRSGSSGTTTSSASSSSSAAPTTSTSSTTTTSTSTRPTTTSTSTSTSSSVISSSTSSPSAATSPSTTTSATVTVISTAASPTNPGYTPASTPVCPAANNTQYTDFAGSVYNIKCGLQINGKNLQAVHADTFDACIEYCDILSGCAGTTYLNGAAATNTNCYPYSQFSSYNTNSPRGVYSAVLANGGTTPGSIDSQSLCPALNGSEFKDPAGYTYRIGCDLELNGADLAPAVTPDLSGCLQFCDTYATCVGVDFGPGANTVGNGYNCYPKSSVTSITYVSGNQFAQLISGP